MIYESDIENSVKRFVKRNGGRAYKFKSPGKRVPDQLVFYPIPEEYRDLVSKYFFLVECKAPGKKPDPKQEKEIRIFRKLGYKVIVADRSSK